MKRKRLDSGFTLIEVLVAVGLLGLLMSGVLTMYMGVNDAYRKGMATRELYLTGLAISDSIDRDLRSAWELDTDLTTFDGKGGLTASGYHLKLVMRLAPQPVVGSNPQRYRLRRLTYANSSTGFTRTLETYDSADPDGEIVVDPRNPAYRKTLWVLTKAVANFQYERPANLAANPRLVAYALYLHKDGPDAWNALPGYQYLIKGQVWLRRDPASGVNPANLTW